MTLHAITVVGRDRPGIIAETTAILADLGLNLTDSTMTLLHGSFSMMLVTDGAADRASIVSGLAPMTDDGDLFVAVHEVADTSAAVLDVVTYTVSVHGGDKPGIVSRMIGVVAAAGGNVTDLMTRLAGDLYVLVAEVDLPSDAVPGLAETLETTAADLGVTVVFSPVVTDDL